MIFLWLFLFYIIIFYVKEYFKRRSGPPGPWPLPIVGNLLQIAKASSVPSLAIAKFSETYGEIFELKVGSKEIVVLSSLKSIAEVLSKEETFGRDISGMTADRNFGKSTLGVAVSEGEFWKVKRAWTFRHLRDYGFNKLTSMEYICNEEARSLLKSVENNFVNGEGIVQISELFSLPTFKVMWTMIRGKKENDKYEGAIKEIVAKSTKWLQSGVFGTGIVNCFPILRFILPKYTNFDLQMDFYDSIRHFAKELFQDVVNDVQQEMRDTPNNFAEAYAMKSLEESSQNQFNEQDFSILFLDLLQGSSDTSSSYLESLILNTVLYPDCQEKVYKEIKQFIPEGDEINFQLMKKMTYTQAFMLEVHRRTKVLPHLVPRKAIKSFSYKGYSIKKDKVVMADLHSAYNDLNIWEKPSLFNPGRFINENGELFNQNMIFPFSIGKRNCPGQTLGEIESFIFFISMVKQFQLSIVPGEKRPREEMCNGLTMKPYPFKILFKKRTK